MDPEEKKVCRHKKNLIIEHIEADQREFEDVLKKMPSLSSYFQNDQANAIKPSKLYELLIKTPDREIVREFWGLFSQRHPDLYDELSVEVQAEKNDLILDSEVRNEARYLVQKHFGGAKFLSEREKGKLEVFLSVRLQVSKDVWTSRLMRIKESLNNSDSLVKECDETIGRIVLEAEERFETQKRRMLKFLPAEKLRRVKSMIMYHNKEYPTKRQVAWRKLETIMARQDILFDFCLTNSEEMVRERMKTIELLGLQGDWFKVELDSEISAVMDRYQEKIDNLKKAASDERKSAQTKENAKVDAMVSLEKLVQEKDQTIQNLTSTLEKLRQISIRLEADARTSREQLLTLRNELDRSRARCRYLESTQNSAKTTAERDKRRGARNQSSSGDAMSKQSLSLILPRIPRVSRDFGRPE